MAKRHLNSHVRIMCGRVIQSKGPVNYAFVDGLNVRNIPGWTIIRVDGTAAPARNCL